MDAKYSNPWFIRIAGAIVLFLVAILVYERSLRYEMIFDDVAAYVENESIRSLSPLFGEDAQPGPLNPKPNTPFTARPLVNFFAAVNFHFGGLDPFGYRLANIAIHTSCALLIWSIVESTLKLWRPEGNRRISYAWVSFLSAVLWLLHPVNTETVIYLTQRTELTMGLFYFLTLYCSIKYWQVQTRRQRTLWLLFAVLSSVAGMLCKEMIASVPAMVFVYDWMFVSRDLKSVFRRSWILYVGLALNWIVAIMLYRSGFGTPLAGFNNTIPATDWWLTQSNAFFVYWKLTVWPYPLVLHYYVPTLTSLTEAWPGVIGFTGYAVCTIWLVRRSNPIGFAMLWFVASLSPTLVIPLPREEISERRLYVAIAAVLPVLVFLIFELSSRMASVRFSRMLGFGACAAIAVLFTVICVRTMPRLASEDIIWLEVLKHHPKDTIALNNEGIRRFRSGQQTEGLTMLEQAYQNDPEYLPVVISLATAYTQLGRSHQAIDLYQNAVEARPEQAGYHYELALLYQEMGRVDLATQHYEETIRLSPESHAAHTNLGLIRLARHETLSAIKHFSKAFEIHPDFENCMNLMNIYVRQQQNDQAIRVAKEYVIVAKNQGKSDIAARVELAIQRLEAIERSKGPLN